jgi:uncharacterized protein (DUF305 family)
MPLADPKYYRSQARELRELAAQLIQAERDELLRIAQHYERLAEKAEKRNAVRPPGSA